jgi:hypothetical protein
LFIWYPLNRRYYYNIFTFLAWVEVSSKFKIPQRLPRGRAFQEEGHSRRKGNFYEKGGLPNRRRGITHANQWDGTGAQI